MSKYTTGEIAKLCGVSVRTVQYYDARSILVPSELSEGGRRLYTEDDLKKMQLICFLRDIGVSINRIAELFAEDKPERVIHTLLEQQELRLKDEISDREEKLKLIDGISRELRQIKSFSVESISDIASVMKSKNKLTRMRVFMLLTGVPITALQWTSIILWITNGLWWLFVIYVAVAIPWGVLVSKYYFKHVSYVCPECNEVFEPKLKEAFWSYHSPRMRRLTCPKCGRRGLCVEVYKESGRAENG